MGKASATEVLHLSVYPLDETPNFRRPDELAVALTGAWLSSWPYPLPGFVKVDSSSLSLKRLRFHDKWENLRLFFSIGTYRVGVADVK